MLHLFPRRDVRWLQSHLLKISRSLRKYRLLAAMPSGVIDDEFGGMLILDSLRKSYEILDQFLANRIASGW